MVENEKKEKSSEQKVENGTKGKDTATNKSTTPDDKSTENKDKKERKKLSKDDKDKALILWFEDLTNDDVCYVGGKNASLGEMYRELTPKGIKIPNGFAVTAYAYNHFLDECDLMDSLSEALEGAHTEHSDLKKVGKAVRKIILDSEFPEDLRDAILEAYKKLGSGDVAVRSSATAEDLPEASFAGQQESYLNVEGEEMVLDACKKCMASLFTNRAISYREDKGFNHFDVYLSVGVMKMVRSDKACAGTMFTIDTETGFSNAIIINGCWGLGENVVQGSVNPDEWGIFKPTIKKDFKPIIKKVLGSKKKFMVYGSEGTRSTVNMDTSQEHQDKFCLEDDEVLQLAKWGTMIEEHYTKRKGKACPMDIEWAKDGDTNEIFIVQARPETVQSQRNNNLLITYKLKGKKKADESTVEEVTKENAKKLGKGKGDEKEAEKAKEELGGKDKKGGDSNEEGKEDTEEDDLKLTVPKSKEKKKEDQENELIERSKAEGKGESDESEKEDSKKKEGAKAKEGAKEKDIKEKEVATGKGEEKKEGTKEKDTKEKGDKEKAKGEQKKDAQKEKGKEEKEKEKGEKKGKGKKGGEKDDKFLADTGKIATARHEMFSKKGEKKDEKKSTSEGDEEIIATGSAVGAGIAAGKARKILSVSNLHEFSKGEILITEMTDPDWEPILKLAAAIVTDSGGRTCHAAIIARELGIPCIVGCGDVTSKIETNDPVTVDCARGDQGTVLKGIYEFDRIEQDLGDLTQTKTKIMMNVADPDRAFELSFIPNSGVGLGRLEFIINNHIGIHPLAILHTDMIEKEEREEIEKRAKGFSDPREFFVSTLARDVAMIAAAFHPKPVIVRFSDFKTNEYANLIGGKHFEPKEDNPMLGWRGASRYYDPTYKEGFALECEAMKRVREEYGLTNLRVMIPMLRTIEEAKRVLEEMKANKIEKSEGEEGLKVMAMCEVPSNCILAEAFLEIVDGFSIGSNDLTQMTLGVDRDSQIVNDIFDERNVAVKTLIAHAIAVCRKMKKYIGICGQAPSDYPEFAEWLVDQGIESMSLNPDTVIPTSLRIYQHENHLSDKDMEKMQKERDIKKKKEETSKEEEKEGKQQDKGKITEKGGEKQEKKDKGEKEEKGKKEKGEKEEKAKKEDSTKEEKVKLDKPKEKAEEGKAEKAKDDKKKVEEKTEKGEGKEEKVEKIKVLEGEFNELKEKMEEIGEQLHDLATPQHKIGKEAH